MTEWMNDARRAGLRAICDTVVPAIARADDPTGFWARKATDVGASPLSREQILPRTTLLGPEAAFGGHRQSGNGHELGAHGLAEFTGIKSMQR
ncbi:hypothetical protein [Ottowia sp.]|uniref:hypothetical protein n=1 Tax=Ottowia sp. TaxID=1898956 RepID=UPI0039E56C88